MSHFNVFVAGPVEEMLAPYDENLPVEPYVNHTGREVKKTFKQEFKAVIDNNSTGEFAELTKKTNPNDINQMREWWRSWCGKALDDDWNSISTYNQESKWDWYEVGGRWCGKLILKTKGTGKRGTKSWALGDTDPYGDEDGLYTDSAPLSQIDFKAMDKVEVVVAMEYWDDVFGGNTPYNSTYVATLQESLLTTFKTKENYANKMGKFSTYALLTPYHGWVEPGEMGWFGISAAQPEQRQKFKATVFPNIIKDLKKRSPHIMISIVDCHI